MSEKEFMKQIASVHMPDISMVKKACIEKLNESKKREFKAVYIGGVAIMAVLMLCLWLPPVNSFAQNIVGQIKAVLNLNGDTVELGEVGKINIEIPEGCEEVIYEDISYLSKSYDTVSDLVKDIGLDIYTWKGSDVFLNQGIMLNIVADDYGRISLLYDVTENRIIDADENQVNLAAVNMFVYFPLSQETMLGDLLLQNEQLQYSTFDDEGNIEEYRQNTEYEMIEQYKSKALDTQVSVIVSRMYTEQKGDLGEAVSTDTLYYLYFTLDGMCYQINCIGTLEAAHEIVENMSRE